MSNCLSEEDNTRTKLNLLSVSKKDILSVNILSSLIYSSGHSILYSSILNLCHLQFLGLKVSFQTRISLMKIQLKSEWFPSVFFCGSVLSCILCSALSLAVKTSLRSFILQATICCIRCIKWKCHGCWISYNFTGRPLSAPGSCIICMSIGLGCKTFGYRLCA